MEKQEGSDEYEDLVQRKITETIGRQADVFRKIFDSMSGAVFILDDKPPYPTILECNRAACTIFGYERQEMIGKTTAFLHVTDETLREFRSLLYPAAEAGSLPFNLREFHMKRKDGSLFSSEHTVTQLLNDKGERTGWVSIVRDITERKRAEESAASPGRRAGCASSNCARHYSQQDLSTLLHTIVERAARLLWPPLEGCTYAIPRRRKLAAW